MKIRLEHNGNSYGGWTRARVSRGIENMAGSFELEVSERFPGRPESWPIVEGDECSVLLNDEAIITGYVDKRSVSFSASEHSIGISGRDKTGDLVDCSAVLGKWEFLRTQVQTLAKRICDEFGIKVTVQARLGDAEIAPLAKLTIDPGDTCAEVIQRACRMAGLLPVSDGAGGLLLTRTGSARATTALVEGENILAATGDFDSSQRFGRYIVSGQHAGSDDFYGSSAAAVKGEASDANVRSTRVLMIRPDSNATKAYAKRRAEWEATVRAAKSNEVSITVVGWTQADDSLWPVNAKVPVRSPMLGIDGEMLITQADYSVDSSGVLTTLTLRPPKTFAPEPVVTEASQNYWKEVKGGV